MQTQLRHDTKRLECHLVIMTSISYDCGEGEADQKSRLDGSQDLRLNASAQASLGDNRVTVL